MSEDIGSEYAVLGMAVAGGLYYKASAVATRLARDYCGWDTSWIVDYCTGSMTGISHIDGAIISVANASPLFNMVLIPLQLFVYLMLVAVGIAVVYTIFRVLLALLRISKYHLRRMIE